MKIIIIGSNGFIGSSAYRFFSVNNEVWGADVVFNGNQNNFFLLEKENTNYELIFKENEFDICINASGNGSVPISISMPVFDFQLNVFNTIMMLDTIRIFNPSCKFINMSSAAVYGNPIQNPISENFELKPLSPYGWHKVYAEQLCKEYHDLYNLNVINLRLFSVYGEYLKKQLFWDIFQKSLQTSNIQLFGTGHETRDFIYIQDLLIAIEKVIEKGAFAGESINIASGVEVSISSAARIFCNAIRSDILLEFNQLIKPGDPLNWRADISTIASFGYMPSYSLENGLTNTAKWMKENQ